MATKKHKATAAQKAQKGSQKKRQRAAAKSTQQQAQRRDAATERRILYDAAANGALAGLAQLIGRAKRRTALRAMADEQIAGTGHQK